MKVALAVLALIIMPFGLGAQEFSGPLLPAGQLRLEVNSLFLFADERFGRRVEGGSIIEKDEPLGFDFEDTEAGARLFPRLEDLEANLTTATGAAITPLVLGQTRAVLTKDAVWIPIRLDLGVFDWLSVGATVPLSRRRAEFETSIQTDGANVGVTPSTAGDFLGSVSAANSALSAIATTLCTSDPSSSECSQASNLLADGQSFLGALTSGAGYGLFPLEGSDTGGGAPGSCDHACERLSGGRRRCVSDVHPFGHRSVDRSDVPGPGDEFPARRRGRFPQDLEKPLGAR